LLLFEALLSAIDGREDAETGADGTSLLEVWLVEGLTLALLPEAFLLFPGFLPLPSAIVANKS
jgi:hypothetical protein